MTAAGWLIMSLSVGSVLALAAFCFVRILFLPPSVAEEHLKAPLDIDTRDTNDAG